MSTTPKPCGVRPLYLVHLRTADMMCAALSCSAMQELWALYDWAHEGQLLGTAKTFSMEYETPITKVSSSFFTAVAVCDC